MPDDVLVVGGGHNGLTAAAYLARSGYDVTVLEARPHTGGCASTVDAVGARVNICNCDHIFVRATPVHDELDLSTHGLSYIDLEPSYLGMRWNGSPWFHFHDAERTLAGLARTHPHAVDGYRRYLNDLLPAARLLLDVSVKPPSARTTIQHTLRRRAAGLATVLRLAKRSAADVLRAYFDDEDLIVPALITGPVVWGVDPQMPGTGLAALAYATKHLVPVGRPVGGSGALTDALRRSAEAAGARFEVDTRVEALLCRGDAVVGVRTTEGGERSATRVVAAIDPSVVLVDWLDGVPGRAAAAARARWSGQPTHDGYESKIDLVMEAPPVLQAATDLTDLGDPTAPTLAIGPDVATLSAMHADAARGRIGADPAMLVNTPSVPDPTMRPDEEHHLLSLEVLWTPYDLDGGWEGSSEPKRWIDRFAETVQPSWAEGIGEWRVMTPVDYEEQFSMRRGYAPSWVGTPLDVVVGRQRELTRYRTPLTGLYLCGAGTYPGAGVWGVSGRNVAMAMCADDRRPPPS
ncbi:MAG: NAD(P)/FAD-dependent oxidoreductase [Actinomycetota bacterium]